MSMNMETWSQRATAAIRAELAWQGRSEAELADFLDADKRTVAKRLAGASPFDLAEVEKIASWLNVAPSQLLARASVTAPKQEAS